MSQNFLGIFSQLCRKLIFTIPNGMKFLSFSRIPWRITKKNLLLISISGSLLALHFFEKSYHFSKNCRKNVWRVWRYFESLIINPKGSITNRRIGFGLFPPMDLFFLDKYEFFHNFGPSSFPKITLNKSLTRMSRFFGEFRCSPESCSGTIDTEWFLIQLIEIHLSGFFGDF